MCSSAVRLCLLKDEDIAMQTIETTGPTVADAVAAGVAELGVDPSQVMVEVLDEGDPGIRGEGARPARVKLLLLGGPPPPPRPEKKTDEDTQSSRESSSQRDRDDRGKSQRRNRRRRDNDRRSRPNIGMPEEDLITEPAEDEIPPEEADDVARTARDVVAEILKHMGLDEAQVGIRRAEPTRDDEEMHWIMNISGRGMTQLIGNRGETLASLQYLTRLIVSRKIQSRANIIVDAAQYKAQRSDRLHDLALRMADQAVRDGRTITLEPMPPNERRIIHLALRDREDVETKSVGEGKSRKVTINPVL